LITLLSTCVRAQTDLTLNQFITLNYSGTYEEFTIPLEADGNVLEFYLRGSDGGTATASSCKEPGGEGAEVEGLLSIGNNNVNQLKPGATVRFIVASGGVEVDSSPGAAGGGGSGTALLYTEGDPSAISATALSENLAEAANHWIILGVAGGGGGGHQGYFIGCIDNNRGDNANSDPGGTNGNGPDGGNGGNAGNGGGQANGGDAGGGGAYFDGRGDDGFVGKRGRATGNRTYRNGNSNSSHFTYGFGSGASGFEGGGGGGGYSGGGGGARSWGGGGGGSFLNFAVINGETRASNNRNADVDDGLVTYAVRSNLAPVAICKKTLTVTLDHEAGLELSPAELDEDSYDPDDSVLSYAFADGVDPCEDLKLGTNDIVLLVEDEDANTDQCTSTVILELNTDGLPVMATTDRLNYTGSYQDVQIPTDSDEKVIWLKVNGGDGGRARIRDGLICNNNYKRGGGGATVQATFPVGFADNTLHPGGILRFIVGEHGANHSVACGSDVAYGGGGGGSAILYKEPNRCEWEILIAAGAGGGGQNTDDGILETYNGEDGRPLEDGSNERSGGNGNSSNNANGGSNGNGGNVNSQAFDTDEGGAGGGAFTKGENGGCFQADGFGGGEAGGTTGGEGGAGSDRCQSRTGGYGFGGGGRGILKGGGGGGYNGGTDEGGGGGSFITSDYSWSNRTSEVEEYPDNQPEDGYGEYIIFSGDPVATIAPNCRNLTVNLGEEEPDIEVLATEFITNEEDFRSVAFSDGTYCRPFDCDDLGTTSITLSIVDNYGRAQSCSVTLAVNDGVVPRIFCDDVFINFPETGDTTITLDLESIVRPVDNCMVTLTATQTEFTCVDAGTTIPITVTGIDDQGNGVQCFINV
ncbi:MAG: hypothetical protein AAGA62_04960, partial [Bacteroidota bacterium]